MAHPNSTTRPPGAGRSVPARSEVARYLLTSLLVGGAYYLAARLSLRLALIEENVTPLWPPTGIAVAAFLVFRRSLWPAVALAAFLVNLPISTNAAAAAATAAGNTAAPLLATVLLDRVGFRREIDRLRDAMAIVFLGALLSMLVSATIGAGTLVASGAIPSSGFLSAWAVWWAGDAMGVLVVAPFLLTLARFRRWPELSPRAWVELVALLAVVSAVSLAVLTAPLSLLFLPIPFVGLAAWRFQQRGAAPAALIVAGLASRAAAHDLGPFRGGGTLFERMIVLQGFNATVAFISLLFAAVVTERARARAALEGSARELEERVRRRTTQLDDAQQIAHVGSWEWLIPQGTVTWSDEMYRIHGFGPGAFDVTFEKALSFIVPEDTARIRGNVTGGLAERRDHDLPDIEYGIRRPDGEERRLLGRAKLFVGPTGDAARMLGTVQDVTETKQAEREHRIAETLQRSLLPDRLPDIPGITLAARYVPASTDMEVGGDWYDVMLLPDGRVALAIGDVAGHGLRAAATMGQLRMALRAYALEEDSPASVVARLHELVRRLPIPEMATLIYLVFDADGGTVSFANAGHPPPLVVDGAEGGSYLEGGVGLPLGAAAYPGPYEDVRHPLRPGSTLVLFTDGLVERRGVSIRDGLDRLQAEAGNADGGLEALCDRLLASLVGDRDVSDDIALLVMQPLALAGRPLHVQAPANLQALGPLRQTVRRWLRANGTPASVENDVLVATGEACSNVIQHAYGAKEGIVGLDLAMVDGHVEVTVEDRGSWRPGVSTDGGRGLHLMRRLMDPVELLRRPDGTTVRMRRRLPNGGS